MRSSMLSFERIVESLSSSKFSYLLFLGDVKLMQPAVLLGLVCEFACRGICRGILILHIQKNEEVEAN